jgi:hypothetical protein
MNNLINKLIIDKYFNIYTRNGLEYIITKNKNYKIFLLDFNNIKYMNEKLGYLKVNDLFKNTFEILKNDYIIGRAFSGDEIFFLTEKLEDNIDIILKTCEKQNLYFKYIEYNFNSDLDDIDIILNKMINNFHKTHNND